MRKHYLFTALNLLRKFELHGNWWSSIYQVRCSANSISPKSLWQSNMQPHTPGTLIESSVHALSHTILLWCPRNSLLHLDSMCNTILTKPSIYVLSSFVWPQIFYFHTCFCLKQGLPLLKSFKNIRFIFQKINLYLSTWVINESDVVPWTSKGCNRRRPPKINMY